jgi:hypothetical protein
MASESENTVLHFLRDMRRDGSEMRADVASGQRL